MFDPVVGRFLEEDPSGFAPGDPDLFRYVENAPTNATDPSGLEKLKLAGSEKGYDEYFSAHQQQSSASVVENKEVIDRFWKSLTDADQASYNRFLNSNLLIQDREKAGHAAAEERYQHLVKNDPDLLSSFQITALLKDAQKWDAAEKKRMADETQREVLKKLRAYDAKVENDRWRPFRMWSEVSGVKGIAEATVRSDLALYQLAGGDLSKIKPKNPEVNRLVDEVRADYEFAKQATDDDEAARQFAFWRHFALTRWHGKLTEAGSGRSLSSKDFDRELTDTERVMCLVEGGLDLVFIALQGTSLAGEAGAFKKSGKPVKTAPQLQRETDEVIAAMRRTREADLAKIQPGTHKPAHPNDTAMRVSPDPNAKPIGKVGEAAEVKTPPKVETETGGVKPSEPPTPAGVAPAKPTISQQLKEVDLPGRIRQAGHTDLKRVGEFFGWEPRHVTKTAADFTKDQLLANGWTKERLLNVAEGYERIAQITPTNPSAAGRAAQLRDMAKLFD